jgi:hypothetical protein
VFVARVVGVGAATAHWRPAAHLATARARLKLSFGTVLGFDTTGTRVRYDTDTDFGSSGAPCFNEGLELVAMHQMAEPSRPGGRVAKCNQGVVATPLLHES